MVLPNYIPEVAILLLLAYLFEGKILPQVLIMFFSLIVLLNEFTTANIPLMVLVSGIMLYSAMQVYQGRQDEN